MTIIEAISQADDLYRNNFSTKQKVIWLSRCEAQIYHDVIDRYEGGADSFPGFTEETDTRTELIMPQPYDEGYIHYLIAQIANGYEEFDRYNNAIAIFNSRIEGFEKWWQKDHASASGKRFLF